jgi:hypothetical protein
VDEKRFDGWTRRRLGLAAGGGGLAALALLWQQRGDDATSKKKKKKRCKNGKVRCGKKCISGVCCGGEACQGTCQCKTTLAGSSFCIPSEADILTICASGGCVQCTSDAECLNGYACIDVPGGGSSGSSGGPTSRCRPHCSLAPDGSSCNDGSGGSSGSSSGGNDGNS